MVIHMLPQMAFAVRGAAQKVWCACVVSVVTVRAPRSANGRPRPLSMYSTFWFLAGMCGWTLGRLP